MSHLIYSLAWKFIELPDIGVYTHDTIARYDDVADNLVMYPEKALGKDYQLNGLKRLSLSDVVQSRLKRDNQVSQVNESLLNDRILGKLIFQILQFSACAAFNRQKYSN